MTAVPSTSPPVSRGSNRDRLMVDVRELSKLFGEVHALEKVTFQVFAGEWIAMTGPSGSGKTTLINVLGGLETPTSGHAMVDGLDVAALSEREMTSYRAQKVGFVFQQFHLVPYLTAVENVMLAQYLHSTADEGEARAALERVGLGDRLDHRPSQLSGGEQQRVAVARALINQPSILLADEPTGNLDDANERIVLELFRELHSEGHTILMVTHNSPVAEMADREIRLEHGRLAGIASPGANRSAGGARTTEGARR